MVNDHHAVGPPGRTRWDRRPGRTPRTDGALDVSTLPPAAAPGTVPIPLSTAAPAQSVVDRPQTAPAARRATYGMRRDASHARRERRSHVKLARRASWNLIDQALSALTNAALSFLVARSVDATGFGAFAVAFMIFTLLIGAERALVGQPLNIRHSATTGQELHEAVARGLGTVVAVILPASLLSLLVGGLMGGVLGTTLMALGVVLVPLVFQDGVRMVYFARSRAQLAAANDALWAVVQFGGVAALILTDRATPASLVLAWGGAAAVCSVVAVIQLRVVPRVGAARSWLREHRDLVGYLFAEHLLGAGALQGGTLLIGGLVGVSNLGALRAAQVLTGPLAIVNAAIMSFGLPEISRRSDLTRSAKWRIALLIGGSMALLSLIYTGVLLLIPDGLGVELLGDTWSGASTVLLPVALVFTSASACLGPAVVIFALGHARETFRLTGVEAALVLGALFGGATVGGVTGAAWFLCVAQAMLVPLWFLQLRSILAADGRRRA